MTKTVCNFCGQVDMLLFQFAPTPITLMTEHYQMMDARVFEFTTKEFCSICIKKMLRGVNVDTHD